MNILNYEQFAKKYGYPTDIDLMSEAISMSSPGNSNRLPKNKQKKANKLLNILIEKIKKGKEAYQSYKETYLIESYDKLANLKLKASGHPDLPSTQAAKRLLDKYLDKITAKE